MNLTVRFHSRLRAGALLVAASLAVMLAGCSASGPGGGSGPIVPAGQTAPTLPTSPRR
jgi:hypothetical protein